MPIESIRNDVNRAKNALNCKKVLYCTIEEIKPKLTLIYSMVGLRPNNYPQGHEKEDLHHYIFLKYGQKTLSELVLAFDLAISGELDLRKEDVKVYDQFTIAYLASIMAAYKTWLFEKSKQVPADKPTLQISDKKELTEEEWAAWFKDMVTYPFELLPVIAYEYLVKNNKINPSTKEKLQAVDAALPIYKIKLQENITELREFTKQYNDGILLEPYAKNIIEISKKILLRNYLNCLKNE